MKRFTHAMLFAMTAFLVSSALLAAQAKAAAQPAAKPATQAPATTPTKFVPPIRGEAELGVEKPQSRRQKDMVVTTIKVKNMSNTGAIAGLRVQEFWYDKGGDLVTGGEARNRKPLLPSEVLTFTIETPYNAKMDRNTYTFTHANGKIKAKQLAKIETPK